MYAPYETTLTRAAAGLLAGAAMGALLVSVAGTAEALSFAFDSGRRARELVALVLRNLLEYAILGFGSFGVGLLLLGVPAWALLHHLGRRGWVDAAVLGVILTFAVRVLPFAIGSLAAGAGKQILLEDDGGPLIVHGKLTAQGWYDLLENGAIFAIIGGIVGFTIWRVAYRQGTLAN